MSSETRSGTIAWVENPSDERSGQTDPMWTVWPATVSCRDGFPSTMETWPTAIRVTRSPSERRWTER